MAENHNNTPDATKVHDQPIGQSATQPMENTHASEIANLKRLLGELSSCHEAYDKHIQELSGENIALREQLGTRAAQQTVYSTPNYHYYPYGGYVNAAFGAQQQNALHTSMHGVHANVHSPIAPMQPLSTPDTTLEAGTFGHRSSSSRDGCSPPSDARPQRMHEQQPTTNSARPPPPSDGLAPLGTVNFEATMRGIMAEGLKTLETQIEQKFTSQLHKATSSTLGIDNLAKGVRETPLAQRITSTVPPKFGNIMFPRFDGMSDPHDHLL